MIDSYKHITTIVGAGAVLDFNYNYPNAIVPSTKNITDSIIKLKIQSLDNNQSDVIGTIYNLAVNALSSTYQLPELRKDFDLNFEELYFIIESMLSFPNKGTEHYSPYGLSPLFALLKEKEELTSYYDIEYIRALYAIVHKIFDIINIYDSYFYSNPQNELWYRRFWQGKENIKYDIFTFNYDTTIEQSIIDYEDGFEVIKGNAEGISVFNPHKLLDNIKQFSTIQHLHGCIYYSPCSPIECVQTHNRNDLFKVKSVQESLKCLGLHNIEQTQAREYFINSPILIGLKKLDKMTYLPSSIYHAELVNKLMKNNGLLIIGYSFNDLYVNQLLQRRVLMRGIEHRMVIIDSFPRYINSIQSLYRYLSDNKGRMLQFLTPFFNIRIENFTIKGINFTSYTDPIYNEDHKCILFICGLKKAVELHSELIFNFL